jgi:L-alanine-DL-glutamate epimerase-like enolase superfamily enzyme
VKITRISAWQVDLPFATTTFAWSGGAVGALDSTVVRVETEEGVDGWGEVVPLGPAYLPSYAEGVRTGIGEVGPHLLGMNATELGPLNLHMDAVLKGHPYVKSAIDMACWDILGKASGLPVSTLLGGRHGESVRLYKAIPQDSAEVMAAGVAHHRSEGYRTFQLKVGGEPDQDIERIMAVLDLLQPGDTLIADANTGWSMHQAARVVRAVRDLDIYIEQPCRSYQECLSIRRRTDLPFILDESMDGFEPLLRGYADGAMDVVNIKVSKFGGLTRAARARELCVEMGMAMIIEDTSGGDVATAAVAHLAHATPERFRFASTDLNGYVTRSYADGAPVREDGHLVASQSPGLGVQPSLEELGEPTLTIGRS